MKKISWIGLSLLLLLSNSLLANNCSVFRKSDNVATIDSGRTKEVPKKRIRPIPPENKPVTTVNNTTGPTATKTNGAVSATGRSCRTCKPRVSVKDTAKATIKN